MQRAHARVRIKYAEFLIKDGRGEFNRECIDTLLSSLATYERLVYLPKYVTSRFAIADS